MSYKPMKEIIDNIGCSTTPADNGTESALPDSRFFYLWNQGLGSLFHNGILKKTTAFWGVYPSWRFLLCLHLVSAEEFVGICRSVNNVENPNHLSKHVSKIAGVAPAPQIKGVTRYMTGSKSRKRSVLPDPLHVRTGQK